MKRLPLWRIACWGQIIGGTAMVIFWDAMLYYHGASVLGYLSIVVYLGMILIGARDLPKWREYE